MPPKAVPFSRLASVWPLHNTKKLIAWHLQQRNVISPLLDRKGFRKPLSETATIKDY
jgi:hypothetical protein